MRSRRVDGVPRHRCSAQVGNSVKRLAGGLSKLVDAARDVDRMSIELKDAQVIVSAKTVEVEALIEQITEKTTIANKRARGVPCGAFDSCPSHDAVGRFLFEFEAVRTTSGPSRRVRETAVASMASS